MFKRRLIITITIVFLLAMTILSYALLLNQTFQEKLGWHVNIWLGQIRVWLNPPQAVAFSNAETTPKARLAIPSPDIATMTPIPTIQEQTVTPTATYVPIPSTCTLEGTKYFSQHNHWNYCGPPTWLWRFHTGDGTVQTTTSPMPYGLTAKIKHHALELQDYTEEKAGLGMIVRAGGDIDLLKHIIAAGFPVIVEKGTIFRDIQYNLTWMGHYQVLTGYNDPMGYFIAQDSYIQADYHQPYETLISEWRSFNYLYMIVYPTNKENDVLNLLGNNRYEDQNFQNALDKAQQEFYELTGVDRFFALFNYGTNLVKLHDYNGAAKAYDQAFELYDALPNDSSIPYRILWYETGPFLAYYYTGRYADVIEKATKNSIDMVRDNEPALEESYYWRGMAHIAREKKTMGSRISRPV
jgi:hypothetical protein